MKYSLTGRMSKRPGRKAFLITIAAYVCLFAASVILRIHHPKPLMISDVSRLMSVEVRKVVQGDRVEDLQRIVREAAVKHLKVSVSGSMHSQGGHTFYPDAVVLNMRKFNRVLKLDVPNKLIRVQSGATWDEVQQSINPYGLAVRVMQSSNIFTVGGSLSVNAHGRDIREGPIIETVDSFRLLKADGTIVNASRTENPELFRHVIGGFGLFGVILDVDIRLTENVVYNEKTVSTEASAFPKLFREQIAPSPEASLMVGRLSVDPRTFLQEMYVTTYSESGRPLTSGLNKLINERHVNRNKFLFGLSRKFDWGKTFSWYIQKKTLGNPAKETLISRNNAMRPEIEFLEHTSSADTDLLQEYFVPERGFAGFLEDMRKIMRDEDVNLMNATVRYVNKNEEAALSYARQDSFAIAIYFNQKLNDSGEAKSINMTERLVSAVQKHGGTYYLPYQLYPTKLQFKAAYPGAASFFDRKNREDPEHLFMNMFEEKYGGRCSESSGRGGQTCR